MEQDESKKDAWEREGLISLEAGYGPPHHHIPLIPSTSPPGFYGRCLSPHFLSPLPGNEGVWEAGGGDSWGTEKMRSCLRQARTILPAAGSSNTFSCAGQAPGGLQGSCQRKRRHSCSHRHQACVLRTLSPALPSLPIGSFNLVSSQRSLSLFKRKMEKGLEQT